MGRGGGVHVRRSCGDAGGNNDQSPAATITKFKQQIAHTLSETVAQTVDLLCDNFQLLLEQLVRESSSSSHQKNPFGKLEQNDVPDYNLYYSCCKQLVEYISENMVTSTDFTQQMDRIILACHSRASERVLRSVVTESIWFHHHDKEQHSDGSGVCPAYKDTKTDFSPREVAMDTPRRSKRRASTTRSSQLSTMAPPKQPRRATTTCVQLRTKKSKDELNRRDGTEESEEKEDKDEPALKTESTSQPHCDKADDLLTFKDAIGGLCYEEKRSVQQTKFFKGRLRKAIQFVDAQLCKPPPGRVCLRDCKKIRAQMCNSDQPCQNRICRIWHDVEAHTDHCQNRQCEVRNRVMLRETMHKIEHTKLVLHKYRTELQDKERDLMAAKRDDMDECERYVKMTLLENKISELERDIEMGEEELGVLKATKKAFRLILDEIGIESKDDAVDNFPDFTTHYGTKKQAKKAETPTKPQHITATPSTANPPRRSERNLRGYGSSSRDKKDTKEEITSPVMSMPINVPPRITKRSATMIVQLVDDIDEETKGGENDGEGDSSFNYQEDSHDGAGHTKSTPHEII